MKRRIGRSHSTKLAQETKMMVAEAATPAQAVWKIEQQRETRVPTFGVLCVACERFNEGKAENNDGTESSSRTA